MMFLDELLNVVNRKQSQHIDIKVYFLNYVKSLNERC